MTIQETIIEALQASHTAHRSAMARIAALMAQNTTLQERVAALEARVDHLETESVKIVEPTAVQALVDSLAQAVAETQAAVRQSTSAPSAPTPPAQLIEDHPPIHTAAEPILHAGNDNPLHYAADLSGT